jgi:hypothetical protein
LVCVQMGLLLGSEGGVSQRNPSTFGAGYLPWVELFASLCRESQLRVTRVVERLPDGGDVIGVTVVGSTSCYMLNIRF